MAEKNLYISSGVQKYVCNTQRNNDCMGVCGCTLLDSLAPEAERHFHLYTPLMNDCKHRGTYDFG